MKKVIRLSESDLILIVNKVIHEQQDLGLKGKTLTPKYAPPKYGENTPEWHHTMNMLLGIGSAFFGPIGMITAAGIGLADAKQYYDEGDTKTAGMVAMFSLLPGAGQIPKLFPAIRQLGSKGMAALVPKLFPGGGSLSKVESEVVQEISENLPLIQQELNAHVMNLAAQGSKTVTNPTTALSLSWTTSLAIAFGRLSKRPPPKRLRPAATAKRLATSTRATWTTTESHRSITSRCSRN
jgi:hypothetical protein